jgi:hypothetical protein
MGQSPLQEDESPIKLIRGRRVEEHIIHSESTKLLDKAERVDILREQT